jgi:hypothetical protein
MLQRIIIPALGSHSVTEGTRADIAKIHHDRRHVPYDANRCIRILDDKARELGWRCGEHWFPHDTAHHELSTGVSRADTLRTLGIYPTVVPVSHVMDGVNSVRRLLSRSWIDEQRCERGLAALQNYRREWDEDR